MNYHLLSILYLLSLLTAACPLTVPQSRVVWFRDHALRVRDNDALDAAVKASCAYKATANTEDNSIAPGAIVPVYLWSSNASTGDHETQSPVDAATGGRASDVFVAHALGHLNRTLFGRLSLGLVAGESSEVYAQVHAEAEAEARHCAEELVRICQNAGAAEVYYLESHDREFEAALRGTLELSGIVPCSFGGGHTLLDYSKEEPLPWKEIIVEHPFRSPLIPFVDYLSHRLQTTNPPSPPKPEPLGLEESIVGTTKTPILESKHKIVTSPLAVEDLLKAAGYAPSRHHWGSSIANAWPASEADAAEALELFIGSLPSAPTPNGGAEGTQGQAGKQTHLASRLSPYLARGLLSPKQVYHALQLQSASSDRDRASFVRRICWRDYTYAVVSLFPDVTSGTPIREGYYPDNENENENDNATFGTTNAGDPAEKEYSNRLIRLWKEGATGFPLVDAGMRQLAKEGWMPQKVRLAVSTCLVEGLGGSWEEGMEHFAEYLVDYDPAINSNMWMNAGCVGFDPYYFGTDYKRRPYWDKDGEYVRRWCPELKDLPDSCEMAEAQRGIGTFKVDCLYEPWSAPTDVLDTAGVILGKVYPKRCCDERRERKRVFERLRNLRAQWPSSGTDDRGRDMVRLGRNKDSESIGMFTPRALLVSTRKTR